MGLHVILGFVCLLGVCVSRAGAEVHKTISLNSVPSGARIFQKIAGELKPIGATPFNYVAEFHSEKSVLQLQLQLAGYEPGDVEITPSNDRVIETLSAARIVALASSQTDPSLNSIQERITPAASGAIQKTLSSNPTGNVQMDGTASLRKLDGAPFLEVPLALSYAPQPSASGKEAARRMWRDIGGKLAENLRQVLPHELAGVVVCGRVTDSDSSFSVGSHAESKTEIACIAGMRSAYDSCATTIPTYENYCNGTGQCFERSTGTRCVAGAKQVYDSCATRGPITKYSVTVDPHPMSDTRQVRLVGITYFSTNKFALAELDESGRYIFRDGEFPSGINDDLSHPQQ